jgi:3-oxoadipate enol-lactonase/4-carboxymuconolactone decarboxylase
MFVNANGLIMHVQVDGPDAAPVLVLIHSLGTSGHVWDEQARALAGPFRVVRPDLRGHGLTGVTPGPYSIAGLAADVLAAMDAIGVGQAHIGGLSIGGLIAQSLAHQAPARAASLILCSTAMAIPPPQNWRDRAALVRSGGMEAVVDPVMARWVTPGFINDPAALGLRAMLLRTAPEGYAAACEALAAADLSADTAALRVPALVVVGDKDESTPPSLAETLRAAVNGSLTILPGAAHIPTIEVPGLVTDAIRHFLLPEVQDFLAAGMAVRRRVLGDAHVDRAMGGVTDFDRDFQVFITRTAWGGVWTRPGLTLRERSLLVLTMLASLGHHEELRLHTRATRNTGATPGDIAEAMMHVAAYAGIPAANSAMRVVKETLAEMG